MTAKWLTARLVATEEESPARPSDWLYDCALCSPPNVRLTSGETIYHLLYVHHMDSQEAESLMHWALRMARRRHGLTENPGEVQP